MIRGSVHLLFVLSLLAVSAAAPRATITLDAAAKSVTGDSDQLESKWVRSKGGQIGFYIQNKTLTAHTPTVKITGLGDGRYDLYVNWGAFAVKRNEEASKLTGKTMDTSNIEPGYIVRGKSAADLAQGILIEVPGRVVPAQLMRCVESVRPLVKSAYEGLSNSMTGEPGRARATLEQAVDWTRSAIVVEEAYRSAQMFVIPAGEIPKEMEWRSRYTTKGTLDSVARACTLLHSARARMYNVFRTEPLLRDTVVGALTPVDVGVRCRLQSGAPRLTVEVRNNCNLGISGTTVVELPKGWKIKGKPLAFSDLKSGEVYTGTLDLAPVTKGQSQPSKLTANSTIIITSGLDVAKLRVTRSCQPPD